MSYSILYQRFLVDNGDRLIPFIIHGSNNVYLEPRYASGRRCRERILTNLFDAFPDLNKRDLTNFLTDVHAILNKEDCWTRFPDSRRGFINMFYRNVIDGSQLLDNPLLMDEWLDENRVRLKR